MPRKLRVEYAGAIYHVMSREDRREDIFLDDADRLLGEHGMAGDTPAGRQEFERHLEAQRLEELDEEGLKVFRRGWCVGGEGFRKEMLEQMEEKLGASHSGEWRRETALSPKEIAGRMHRGTSRSSKARLYRWMKEPEPGATTGTRLKR